MKSILIAMLIILIELKMVIVAAESTTPKNVDGMAEIVDEIFSVGLTPVFFSNISDIHYFHVMEKLSFSKLI